MNFTFLSTKWNCVFIAIMVILIIAIIAEKIKQNPKRHNWTWANVYKTIKDKLAKSVVLYIFRWILVLSMGALGYVLTDNVNTFWLYIVLGLFALAGAIEENFEFLMKIGLLLQMIGLGIFVLVTISWKLALVFIPLAFIGWFIVPNNGDEMPWY